MDEKCPECLGIGSVIEFMSEEEILCFCCVGKGFIEEIPEGDE